MQALGGDKGREAMEEAGFEEVTVTPESVAFYVTPTFGYKELFTYMASCTPADVRKAAFCAWVSASKEVVFLPCTAKVVFILT